MARVKSVSPPLSSTILALSFALMCAWSLAGPICGVAPKGSCKPLNPNYNYSVPFGNAYWNIRTCELGRWTHSDEYRDRWWYHAHKGSREDQKYNGELLFEFGSRTLGWLQNPDEADFSSPIYDARQATTTRLARVHSMGGGVGTHTSGPNEPKRGTNFKEDEQIPWNPAWKTCEGSDRQMIIINPDTGLEIDIWYIDYGFPWANCLNLLNPYDESRDICAGQIWKVSAPNKTVMDYRTYEGPSYGGSAAGLPGQVGVVRAVEVQAGEIRHALAAFTFATLYGPSCVDSDMNDPTKFGHDCGYVMLPGAQFEYRFGDMNVCQEIRKNDPEMRRKFTPEGIRFAVDITDEQIEEFLDQKNYTGPKRNTARIIAVALREYGFMILGTTCWSTAIFTDGNQNPETRQIWQSLGIDPVTDPSVNHLLSGLFTREQVYVVAPPVDQPNGNKWWVTANGSRHDRVYTSNFDCPPPGAPNPQSGLNNSASSVLLASIYPFMSLLVAMTMKLLF